MDLFELKEQGQGEDDPTLPINENNDDQPEKHSWFWSCRALVNGNHPTQTTGSCTHRGGSLYH